MGAGPSRPSAFATAEEIIVGRARREPHRGAFGWRDRMILLGRFAGHVDARAEVLASSLPRGGVLAQVMSDTPGSVATTLAAWRHGATSAPLDPGLSSGALAARLELSAVDAVVAHEEHADHAGEALRTACSGALLLVSRGLRLIDAGRPGRPAGRGKAARVVDLAARRARRAGSKREDPAGGVNEIAFHAYLPGGEARPRAALLTHANVISSALRTGIARGDGHDDVALAAGPLWDVQALVGEVLARLVSGGSIVLPGPGGPREIHERIDAHRVTDLSLSAAEAALVAEATRPARRVVRSVRKVLLRDPELHLSLTQKREITDRFPAAELLQSWGRVETTGPIATSRQGAVFRKPDTLGTPHPGLVVGVVDADGRPARPGQRGEIVCRGAVVMRSYLGAAAATREVLRDGWLHTGDLGYIDGDGDLSSSGVRARETRRPGTD
ncbi:MAG: AMP-binding protein [Alphaproteobacteria bacterium]